MSTLEFQPHFKIIKDVEATTLFCGPFGTQVNQLSNYTFTGVFPAISANSDVIVSAPAAHAQVGDSVFVTTVGAVPTGLSIGNAYVAVAGIISFKISNITASPFAGGGSYTASLMDVQFALNI